MLVTLAMLDTMHTPMLDMPTMDKLRPHKQQKTEQPSLFSSSVTTKFQCLTSFFGD